MSVIRDYNRPKVAAAYGKRPGTTRAECRALRHLLGELPPGRSILDVPCGKGRLAPVLRELEPVRLIGIDAAPAMLGHAAGLYDVVLSGSAFALPLPDDSVDVAVCMRLLHHFRESGDRGRILSELARVARDRVVCSYYDLLTLEGLRRVLRPRRSARSGLRASRLRAEAAAAGLRPVRKVSLFPCVREQSLLLAAVGPGGRTPPSGPG